MGKSLFCKVWMHTPFASFHRARPNYLFGLHLIHEVTSPQAFQMMRERGLKVAYPDRTYATVDHIVPTDIRTRPLMDSMAEEMLGAIEENTQELIYRSSTSTMTVRASSISSVRNSGLRSLA